MDPIKSADPSLVQTTRKKPGDMRVNFTIYDVPRDMADKIIDEAVKIAGRINASMESIEPIHLRYAGE